MLERISYKDEEYQAAPLKDYQHAHNIAKQLIKAMKLLPDTLNIDSLAINLEDHSISTALHNHKYTDKNHTISRRIKVQAFRVWAPYSDPYADQADDIICYMEYVEDPNLAALYEEANAERIFKKAQGRHILKTDSGDNNITNMASKLRNAMGLPYADIETVYKNYDDPPADPSGP